ncbi:hypothetical protein E2320_011213 [Naja naja]|nr:hypothetical protein E2320_011213 [Naja naja]
METFRIWLMLAVLWNFCERIMPCGLSTHIEIAHRGMEFFSQQFGQVDYRKLILAHQDAYQAGSLYPDAFYPGICQNGKFHYVSEDTHWSPFLNTSIHYIRKNYPQPWEEATEKLVAFLFGIASHMVADVSWHSLGIEQGFLRAMAAIDFHGSYSQAHPTGDFGGDVLSQYELDFDYLKASCQVPKNHCELESNVVLDEGDQRYVPVKDLLSIYEDYYGKEVITENTIVDCTYLQLLELYAEIIAVAKLYPIYANKSPFLVDKFYDYFLGGVDDMAFSSSNIFQLTSWMLNYGTSGCFIPENPLFIRCEGEQRNFTIRFKESRTQHHRKLTSEVAKSVEKNISYTERGVYLKVPHWTKPRAMTSADLNQDGYDDLVIGAPGYSQLGHIQLGRVYIVYGNESGLPHSNLDLDQEADEILEGTKPSGRFGSAIAILDFNVDGILDLAVGAPSVGAWELSYRVGNWFCIHISWQQRRRLPRSSKYYHNLSGLLFVSDADWMVKGETDYGWFGSSLSSVQLLNKTLLLIGSPFGRNCTSSRCYFSQYNKQAVGTVYGYIPPNTKSWFTLSGGDENGKFGSALATGFLSIEGISKQVLIVGAPTQGSISRMSFISSVLHQAGGVLIYDLMGNGTPSLLSTFNGDRKFSRFGEEVHLQDLNNDGLGIAQYVIISPECYNMYLPFIWSPEAVCSIDIAFQYCFRSNLAGAAVDTLITEHVIGGYIFSLQEKSRFGSTLLTMKTGEKSEVIVAAERSSTKARLSGRLFLYTF